MSTYHLPGTQLSHHLLLLAEKELKLRELKRLDLTDSALSFQRKIYLMGL